MGVKIRAALLCLVAVLTFCHSGKAQSLNFNLVGNDGTSINLADRLLNGGTVPDLCVGVSYSLVGDYSLTGVCTSPPQFTATVNLDGSVLFTRTGLTASFNVPIPASVTAAPGSHVFSLALSGGTAGPGVSCAQAIQSQLTTNQVTVKVVSCGGSSTIPASNTPVPTTTAPGASKTPKEKANPLDWLKEAIEKYKASLMG